MERSRDLIIREPARETPIVAQVDVLVAGGGPAGIAAAVAAARTGADTMLVERYGYLGGLATGGLVLLMDQLFDRNGERCVGGVHWESLERLRSMGGLAEQRPTRLHVDSELYKIVADEMCVQAGVRLRLHSWVVDALLEGDRVTGVVVESKSGRQAILCRVCVDATGDADIAAFAGAGYDLARMCIGLNLKVGGVDGGVVRAFRQEYPDRVRALRRQVRALGGCPLDVGATPYSDRGVYWVNTLGLNGREGKMLPLDHAADGFAGALDAVDVEDMTFVEVEMRKRMAIALDFYRKNMPGFEDVHLLSIAAQLGVRDSRRVRGMHTLTKAEMDAGVCFEDSVGITGQMFANGQHLQVPYRALVPESVNGLVVSGRCISVDDGVIHSIRLIPACMMIGQAAGTAAALARRAGVQPRDVDVDALRRQLVLDGVILS